MSYTELSNLLKACKNEYNGMHPAQKKSEYGVDLFSTICCIDAMLKQMDSAVAGFHRPIGNYKRAFK